jgi:hypothetical protein
MVCVSFALWDCSLVLVESVGAGECWLRFADRALGDGVCELVGADEREHRRDGDRDLAIERYPV